MYLECVSKCIIPVLSQQNANTGKMNKAKETASQLVKAGCNAAVFLELEEEQLDKMTFFV